MNKEIFDRLETFIEHNGLNKKDFATFCGLNYSTLVNALKLRKNITVNTLYSIIDAYPELNIDWLLRGSGPMWKENTQSSAKLRPDEQILYDMPIGDIDSVSEMEQEYKVRSGELNLMKDLLDEKDKRIGAMEESLELYRELITHLKEKMI